MNNPVNTCPGTTFHQARISRLTQTPTIHPSACIVNSHIGKWSEVGGGWSILESILDDYTYASGTDGIIHYARIGRFCSLASHVVINPGNHPMNRVTQHHITYRRQQYGLGADDDTLFEMRRSAFCVIDHDVWIGHGAMVMAGVHINTGAVIGAGAVVTHDVSPYHIVVGVPAVTIRKRFSDAVAEKLMASRWWRWDHEKLQERIDDLVDIDRFIEKYC
jgi:phosphonate metabolism protein (transferase hexapeptide repeat family)